MLKEGCRCLAQVSSVCQTANLEQPNLFQILLAGGYRTICLGKIQLGWGTDLSWQNEAQPAWRWTGLVKVTVNIYLLLKLLFITQHLLVTNLLKFLTLLKHLLPSSSLTSQRGYEPCLLLLLCSPQHVTQCWAQGELQKMSVNSLTHLSSPFQWLSETQILILLDDACQPMLFLCECRNLPCQMVPFILLSKNQKVHNN